MKRKRRKPSRMPKGPALVAAGAVAIALGCGPKKPMPPPPQAAPQGLPPQPVPPQDPPEAAPEKPDVSEPQQPPRGGRPFLAPQMIGPFDR